MGYFLRPIFYQETKKQFKEFGHQKYGFSWIINMCSEMLVSLRTNNIKLEDLYFGGLGYIISDTPLEVLDKYFFIYEMRNGKDGNLDRIYEFKINKEYDENVDEIDGWYKTKQSFLDTMWNDLEEHIDNEIFTEERKLEVKEDLRMMLDSGFMRWEYG
tara:strand:+ start:587 stop:1060 length:474 start_codon:yes stop_codon:yes gene_type:complete